MKKFCAMLLVVAMMLSLCACGGKEEEPDTGVNTQPVVDSAEQTEPVETDEPVEKVHGSRVLVADGLGHITTDWELGPVDVTTVFALARIPLGEQNAKATTKCVTKYGAELTITRYSAEHGCQLVSATLPDGTAISTELFNVDGQTYTYVDIQRGSKLQLLEGSEGQHLYKTGDLHTMQATTTADAGIINNLHLMEVETYYKSCEYVEQVDGIDWFVAKYVDDDETEQTCRVGIDHETGWIVSASQDTEYSGREEPIPATLTTSIEYGVEYSNDFDLATAEDDVDNISSQLIFAQLLIPLADENCEIVLNVDVDIDFEGEFTISDSGDEENTDSD